MTASRTARTQEETVPSQTTDRPSGSSRSRAESAYEGLRAAIVTGQLRPNERLVETELAKRLQISRTPIRESFLRLAGEGLIKPSGQGWIVREHTRQEVQEIYEVRAALEGYAARLAARHATPEELERINQLYLAHLRSLDEESRTVTLEHNDEFHDAIVSASRNTHLGRQIKQNREHYFMYRVAAILSDKELREAMREHVQVLDALNSRDEDAAERAARDLILGSMTRALARLA
jgi:DNA-binding GntR family transcriptional regulator